MSEAWHPEEIELSAYLDGELDHDKRASVDSHLESCRGCQVKLERLELVFQQLASITEEALNSDLSLTVLAELRSREPMPGAKVSSAEAPARPAPRNGFIRTGAGWIAALQAGLAALLLALFGSQAWQVGKGWMGAIHTTWLQPAIPWLQQQLALAQMAIAERVGEWWLAAVQITEQPLPLNIPGQQALLIVAATGLAWLIGNRLLIGKPTQRA